MTLTVYIMHDNMEVELTRGHVTFEHSISDACDYDWGTIFKLIHITQPDRVIVRDCNE